jgi:hypothetical protein
MNRCRRRAQRPPFRWGFARHPERPLRAQKKVMGVYQF